MEKPFISIIIPTWRGSKVLNRCLSSLLVQDYPQDKFEIILVSKENLPVKWNKTKVIKIGKNVNHALARNIGVAEARGEIIAFCDDDCILPKNWLSVASDYFVAKGVDLIGGPIVPQKESPFSYRIGGYLSGSKFAVGPSAPRWRILYPEGEATPFDLILANTFVRKKSFEEVGGFDPDQVPCEENLFYYKLRNKGLKLFYTPKIACFHPSKPIFLPYTRKVFFYSIGRGMLLAREPKTFHLAFVTPSLFVIIPLILLILSPFFLLAFSYLLAILLIYSILNLAQALYIFCFRERDLRVFLAVPITTFMLHTSYGLGVLRGFLRYKLGKRKAVLMPNIPKA